MKALVSVGKMIKKYATRAVAILALAATFAVPASINNTYATGSNASPRFNFLSGDVEMLTAANTTRGQATWSDPVNSAKVGDEIVFRFYFHNGKVDTTAHNVILRANLPQADATVAHVNSYLSSDETAVINDTVIDGKVVGYGQGFSEINLADSGHLEYVPGSTKIWRHSPEQWGAVMSDGIVSGSGLNIGNVNGCWDYAGYVTFKTRIVATATPAQLVINKYVSTSCMNEWVKYLDCARENDTISYKVVISNTGQTAANNVSLKDTLPNGINYINGSTKLYSALYPNGVNQTDEITSAGLNIQSIASGSDNQIYFTFNARIAGNLNYDAGGSAKLINTAEAIYDNKKISDQAIVTVCGNNAMTIRKEVWNGSSWTEQNHIKLGEHIRYRIILSNTGQMNLSNIKLSDVIPVYTNYIEGSTKVNGSSYNDGIAAGGISLSNLGRNNEMVVEFEVATRGCPPISDYTLVNTAYAQADGVPAISGTASTIMTLIPVSGPNVSQL